MKRSEKGGWVAPPLFEVQHLERCTKQCGKVDGNILGR